jgi:type VI protein secretion system component VasF
LEKLGCRSVVAADVSQCSMIRQNLMPFLWTCAGMALASFAALFLSLTSLTRMQRRWNMSAFWISAGVFVASVAAFLVLMGAK